MNKIDLKNNKTSRLLLITAFIIVVLIGVIIIVNNKGESNGFKGFLLWETAFDSVKNDMTFISTDTRFVGVNNFSRKNDNFQIGSGTAKAITYAFWQNKLYSVTINIDGYENWSKMHQSLIKEFGEPSKLNGNTEDYYWYGDATSIQSVYWEFNKKGLIIFTSQKLSNTGGMRKASN